MLRPLYLFAMGASVGAVAAAVCGHPMLWIATGMVLGLLWSSFAPEAGEAVDCTRRRPALPGRIPLAAWLAHIAALRRVSFVVGLA